MTKGCQKDFTTHEQRQLINITLRVASPSLFEALFPEVALELSWKEREHYHCLQLALDLKY